MEGHLKLRLQSLWAFKCRNSELVMGHTGCPTKNDSWWVVFNVFFHDTVLVIQDFLQFISLNKSFTQIYICLISILLPFSISCHYLWYQTTWQIMAEDILD